MNFFKQIFQSQTARITSLNSISVILKVTIGLITSKLLAVFVGPSGLALIGNLRNFISSLENVAALGFQNGVVKYVAENEKDQTQISKIMTSVFAVLFVLAVLLSSILFGFSDYFNQKIFGNNTNYLFVIKALALALPFYTISTFFLAFINGLGKYRNVILTNIAGNIIGLVASVLLIYEYKTFGALLSIVITPALLFIFTYYYLNKEINIIKSISSKNFDFEIIKKMSSFSLMALVSAVFGPIILFAIRQEIIASYGLEQAGFWESMSRISSNYLMFVTTILTIYFLPRLIKANTNQDTKKVFGDYFKYILTLFTIGAIFIYFSRDYIIKILFTEKFMQISNLFFWQLIGDVFKVASLILGYQFFAKRLTKAYIIFEIFGLLLLYFASIIFLKLNGLEGVIFAQALENFVYFIVLIIYFRKILF